MAVPKVPPGSATEADIVRRYLSGDTIYRVSRDLGLSEAVVYRVLVRTKTPCRSRGYAAYAKDGLNYHQRAYRKLRADPERWSIENDRRYFRAVRRKYGLTREAYEALLAHQDGRCAICGGVPTKRLRVDHCHQTGKVRGLLCDLCNSGIGKLRDDPDRLARAIEYLQTNPADQVL